ncbi:MAG: glycosyltransferase [Micropepsaceae bacterium]
MKILLLHHPYVTARFEQDLLGRVAERPEFTVTPADPVLLAEGRLPVALSGYDAVVVFVAFNALRRAPPLDWQGFEGLRLLFDHDVIQNYSDIFDPGLKGLWTAEFARHRFDALITSGDAVRRRLEEDGVPADWLPKAFDPSRFTDRAGARAGIVTYGSKYHCRQIAERALREAGVALVRLDTTPYPALAAELSPFLAGMAVSSDLPTPAAARAALASVPARDVAMRPGLEPMAKLFELAGSGCCPMADAMEDLALLGFVDGVNAVTFTSHAELVEKARHWLARPDELRALGSAAARLAHERHSWADRAETLSALIARRLQA